MACASLLLAEHLASDQERRKDRGRERAVKMRRVVERKTAGWVALEEPSPPTPERLAQLMSGWPEDERRSLMVELVFADPFAPYSLSFRRPRMLRHLRCLAPSMGLSADVVDEVEEARHAALRSHRKLTARRMAVVGLAAAVAVGSAGYLAAPAIGTALGASAGLSGVAATSYGLALLGGGSLAAGGAGMAGGMWLVAGTGAAVGLVGGTGSALLLELGASETRAELVKLQVTFRVSVLGTQTQLLKAREVIGGLARREAELDAALVEERTLNDENARRVKELASKLEDLVTTREWIENELEAAGGR